MSSSANIAAEITAGNLPLGNSNSKEILISVCQYRRNCLPPGGVRPEETINSFKENNRRNGIRGIYEFSPSIQVLSYIHLASTAYPKTNFGKKILLMSIEPERMQRNRPESMTLKRDGEEITPVWKQSFIL